MITKTLYHISQSLDPYENLTTEKYLLDSVEPGSCILYLWRNENTVVIGRNQNPWVECRLSLLEQEGGRLARRLSGGGAVFHDKGNLNFTFIMPTEDYDLHKQLSVIECACASAGIVTERSGRNDILAQGCKFSGNAFYHAHGRSYHHGTLLINANMEKLGRYLSPSKAKLSAKGVASVRSRVTNLQQLSPTLTCKTMEAYLLHAFETVYGLTPSPASVPTPDAQQVAQMQSFDWLFGRKLPVSFCCEGRFSWGGIQLQLQAEAGVIGDAQIYTDAMDWTLSDSLKDCLIGCAFRVADMVNAVKLAIKDPVFAEDIIQLLEDQDL